VTCACSRADSAPHTAASRVTARSAELRRKRAGDAADRRTTRRHQHGHLEACVAHSTQHTPARAIRGAARRPGCCGRCPLRARRATQARAPACGQPRNVSAGERVGQQEAKRVRVEDGERAQQRRRHGGTCRKMVVPCADVR
jgi:hypothetical protein